MIRLLMPSADYGMSGDLSTSYVGGLKDTPCTILKVHLGHHPGRGLAGIPLRAVRRYLPQIGYQHANRNLLRAVRQVKPHVVWLFKGMEIYSRTLSRLRQENIILVNYNADHPFEFYFRGSGNANVRASIPQYDLHITYSRHIARQLCQAYPDLPVTVIPFGHDVDEEQYRALEDVKEIPRAAFIGNPDKYRRGKLLALASAGIALDVYGHRWESFLQPIDGLRLMGPLSGQELLLALRAYRVQLNLLRPHNIHSHNMRSFEVPACGGIMLAEDTLEHRQFFENGHEAFYFSSEQEMIERTHELLALPKEQADRIRAAARQRCVNGDYSYRARAHQALAEISNLVRLN